MKYALCMVMLAACGGSDTPANDAHNTQPSATATATDTAPTATATGNGTSSGKAPSADMSRGINALQNADYPTAKSAFEAAVAANARDADAHHYLAVTLEKTNDKTGAEREYKAALAIKPDLAEAAANLGALYVDAQKWDEAIAVLKPEAQKRADSSAVQFNLALAYAGKNDQANAKTAFESALKSAPTDAMILYTYGHMLGAWGQNEAAVAKLKAATLAAGNQGELLGSIGHELLVNRAPADCVAAFDKAIASKDGAQFRTERALCKLATKDDAGATSDLEAAVTADPKYGLAHYWLATRRMGQKRWADAAKELEAYLKIEPNGPKAKTAQEALAVAKNGGKKK
jgi:Tfp pilus assembly protein PilF